MSEEYGLGRRVASDPRDFNYLARQVLALPLKPPSPRSSPYYRTGRVLDQGSTPQCVGYSWRQWLSSAPIMSKGGPDASLVYREAQLVDEWPGQDYDGTSVRAGAKVLHALGHIHSYWWGFNSVTVRDWILDGWGTVVLGINWYEAMFHPDNDGCIEPRGPLRGGHALLCVGYSAGRKAFRLINSWGEGWGQKGRCWLRAQDLDLLLEQQGEACMAVEQQVGLSMPSLPGVA